MHATLIEQIDDDLTAVRGTLDALPPAQRDVRPSPDAWSAAEIAEHLAAIESGLADVLGRAVEAAAGRTLPDLAGGIRMRSVRRGDGTDPPDQETPESIAEALRTWQALVDGHPSLTESSVFFHPVSGPHTLAETVRHVAARLASFRRQLDLIANAAGDHTGEEAPPG